MFEKQALVGDRLDGALAPDNAKGRIGMASPSEATCWAMRETHITSLTQLENEKHARNEELKNRCDTMYIPLLENTIRKLGTILLQH